MKTKIIIVIGAAALGIGGMAYQQGMPASQDDIFYHRCEEILKARLVSPSSYTQSREPFVFITDENVATALMRYDASNALGVMIGGTAVCTLELGQESKLPEGDYRFKDVRVDGTTEIGWQLNQINRMIEPLK